MQLGLEVLLQNTKALDVLRKQRVGVVCHPASVDRNLNHALDLLAAKLPLSCAFGPQHGVRGDKQDNMIESEDFIDPVHNIPVFSLYGKVRRPTAEMLAHFDVLLFDLQDLGCRIYTFITTLLYVMQACAEAGKKIIILDRPNPIGRNVEGFRMLPEWASFVGAAPIPMRHGLTLAELALYFKQHYTLDLVLEIIKMRHYSPQAAPGFGWDMKRAWVNPSPNAANLNMARAYPGTVLIEGTHLSEGRGTTRALEVIGDAHLNFSNILKHMYTLAPQWHKGVTLRECFFEPTFHKHQGKLCHGFQFHTDCHNYLPNQFKPFRLIAVMLKSIRELYPEYSLYRDFAYEYVDNKLAFDVINGGPALRNWVDEPNSTINDLQEQLIKDETAWKKEYRQYWLYK